MTGPETGSAGAESGFRVFLRAAFSRDICIASIKVALVVGSLLNLVNQGTRLWNAEPVNWFTFCLNFVVPYCVATYSAAMNELRHRHRESTH